jgi:spermidine/putrescine transport system substrate-binding protein
MKLKGVTKVWLGAGFLLPIWGLTPLASAGESDAIASSAPELVCLTWTDYIDPDLVEAFERSRGVKVRFVYFETDEERNELMAEAGGKGFDLAVVNSPNIPVYRRFGWLSPLGPAEVPNIRHIAPRWSGALAEAQGYAVPYFWGTTGIAYRRDLVPEPITSWRQYFSPPESLRGKIGAIRNSRDMIGMALKSLGFSANSVEPAEILAAEAVLAGQRPFLGQIGYLSLLEDSELVTGRLWVAMIYNGDALVLKNRHPDIVFTLPEEGGEVWIDYLTVLASSDNKGLAADFIDFVNQPSRAARNALFVQYATPNAAAEPLLPEEFLSDPAVYPGDETLKRSEFYVDLPANIVRLRNDIYTRVIVSPPREGAVEPTPENSQ